MKKIFILAIIFVTILFVGCDDSNQQQTILTINNLSDFNLHNVEYGTSFGTINSGQSETEEVDAGTRFVFFFLKIGGETIRCRIVESITTRNGESHNFNILNSTVIEIVGTPITGTLINVFNTLMEEYNKPYIVIRQGNNVIEQFGEFDFGSVLLGAQRELVFTIENTGGTNLTIQGESGSRINLTENISDFFSVHLQPLSPTVLPGASATFNLRFSPTTVGNNFDAVILINTNSSTNDEFIFRVRGNGTTSLQVGDTGPGGGTIFFAVGGEYMEVSGELGVFTWHDGNMIAQNPRGGFADWRLPTIEELMQMYESMHLNGFGGFTNAGYWSSSRDAGGWLWHLNFANGSRSIFPTSSLHRVRAVRGFSVN